MKDVRENPGTKIFIQVTGTVLTAVILYFIGINASGELSKIPEKENAVVNNEIYNINQIPATAENKDQNSSLDNLTKSISDTKTSSPEQLNGRESAELEAETKLKYSSEVMDENGKGIANVEIYCPNCEIKKVKTDKEGVFNLVGYFDKNSAFWQSTLTLSKDKKSKIETIDWRENSPKPINL